MGSVEVLGLRSECCGRRTRKWIEPSLDGVYRKFGAACDACGWTKTVTVDQIEVQR